ILQNFHVVVISPHQRSLTVGTDRALGKIPRRHTGYKPATATLQSPRNTLADSFLGNFEPDREIKGGVMPYENRRQPFGLRSRARESIKNKTVRTVQAQPIFDQFYNRRIRDEATPLNNLGSLDSQGRTKVFFPPQDCPRRCDRNPKLPCNKFSLGALPRTGRAKKNKPFLHSAAVKKNGDSSDDENGDRDVKPHQRLLRGSFTTVVSRAGIESSPANSPFAQEPVVMALNQVRFDLAHRIQHYTNDNEQARPAEKL